MAESSEARTPDIGALYLEYREVLLRTARYELSKFRAVNRAPEAVHDVFARLMTSAPQGPVVNWKGYLVSAVRNRAQDLGVEEAAHDRRSEHAIAAHVEVDEIEAIEAELDRGKTTRQINQALAELPEVEQIIVMGIDRDGRKNRDLAEELGMSPGRVSQLHKQALEHFRAAYERLGGER